MRRARSALLATAAFVLVAGCAGRIGGAAVPAVPTGPGPAAVVPTGPAAAALAGLAVKNRARSTGYSRTQFGDAWTDDVDVDGGHNGCDTRNDILRRDLRAVVVKPGTQGCVALTGILPDPYTGRSISFRRGATTSDLVQIDHVVALSNAWQTGAQQLPDTRRQDLANDPVNLLAADGQANQDKSDSDAAAWLPPNGAERCRYVARQIAVKARYTLWVTGREKAAMAAVLATCPDEPLPTEADTDIPSVRR